MVRIKGWGSRRSITARAGAGRVEDDETIDRCPWAADASSCLSIFRSNGGTPTLFFVVVLVFASCGCGTSEF